MKNAIMVLCVFILLSGCADRPVRNDRTTHLLRIKGSDSMLLLVRQWAEIYTRVNTDIEILVEGGGSGSGIAALIEGSIDICASSRPMSAEEVRSLAGRYQSIGVSILCARDALGIIVHPSNPIANLSVEHVRKIFTGEITTWKDVGWIDEPIILYGREPNSGTFLYLEEHVLLGKPYSKNCIFVPGARALVDSVSGNPFAIGYSTSVYAQNVKLLSIDGHSHSPENVRNGIYPISRYLYFYTVHPPEGTIKKFIDWVVSTEGQRIARENGYVPLYDE